MMNAQEFPRYEREQEKRDPAELARKTKENIDRIEEAATGDAERYLKPAAERLQKARRNKLLQGLLVAVGLHAAAFQAESAAKHTKAFVSEMESWDGRVLHPQSKAEQQSVEKRVEEREKRIDQKALDAYREKMQKALDRGEDVSFEDIEFHMEELNGVPLPDVMEARRNADTEIAKWAPRFAQGVTRQDLDQFVREMYGPDANYEWGQGSVTTYLRTKKRNCHSIAKGQMIVLDGILRTFDAKRRAHYQLGTQYVQQHEYATFSVVGIDGAVERTYLLEPGVHEVHKAFGEAGTATISMDALKKAIVADSPKMVDAVEGKDIPKGPRFDAVIDQPVRDNVLVNGQLRPSEFVLSQIGEAAQMSDAHQDEGDAGAFVVEPDVMDLTFIESMTVERATTLRQNEEGMPEAKLSVTQDMNVNSDIVKAFNDWHGRKGQPWSYRYHNLDQTPDTVVEMLHAPSRFLRLDLGLNPGKGAQIRDGFEAAKKQGVHFSGELVLESKDLLYKTDGTETEEQLRERVELAEQYEQQRLADLQMILEAEPVADVLEIDVDWMATEGLKMKLAESIAKSKYPLIVVDLDVISNMRPVLLDILKKTSSRIALRGYYELVQQYPWILKERFEPTTNVSSLGRDAAAAFAQNLHEMVLSWKGGENKSGQTLSAKELAEVSEWIPALEAKERAYWRVSQNTAVTPLFAEWDNGA